MMCDWIDTFSFRILNSVFRGHVTANGDRLSHALKIIMHSNYLHTKDHHQRVHQDLDLDLDDVDLIDAPPADRDRGSGFVFDDFDLGDKVLVWRHRVWWNAKVTYKSRAGTLSVRIFASDTAWSGVLPKHIKPAVA
jgi:hypothetical protein